MSQSAAIIEVSAEELCYREKQMWEECVNLLSANVPAFSKYLLYFSTTGGLLGEKPADIKFLTSHKHPIHQLARPPFRRNSCWSF